MKLRNKKTGDVIECEEVIITKRVEDAFTNPYTKAYRAFSSIAELNAEWEDYKPAEPLIKDKKIRKAVRAWAEVNSIKKALYAERPDRSLCVLNDMGEDDYSIDLVGWIPTLKDGEEYTIAELCGEEEE